MALPRVILALMGVKMAVPATVGKYMPLVTVRLAHIVTNVKISDVSLQLNIYFHYLLLQLLLFSFFVFLLCYTFKYKRSEFTRIKSLWNCIYFHYLLLQLLLLVLLLQV